MSFLASFPMMNLSAALLTVIFLSWQSKNLKDSRNQRTQKRHLFLGFLFYSVPITIEYRFRFIFNDVDFYFYLHALQNAHDFFLKSVNSDSHKIKKENK